MDVVISLQQVTRSVVLAFLLIILTGCGDASTEDSDFSAAQEAALQQDWPQAARLVQRTLRTELDPEKRWAAWELLVEATHNMGENQVVIDHLETMLLEFGAEPDRAALLLRDIGEMYEKTREWDKAIKVWESLAQYAWLSNEDAAVAYRRIGLLQQRRIKFKTSCDMFLLCSVYTEDPVLQSECLYYTAMCLADNNVFDASLDYSAQSLAVPGISSVMQGMNHLLQGDVYQQQGNVSAAKAAFETALLVHPNKALVEMRLQALEE